MNKLMNKEENKKVLIKVLIVLEKIISVQIHMSLRLKKWKVLMSLMKK
jgi:hypothetical protein